MGGVDHEDGVELEADRRPGLDVSHARQEQAGEELAVAQARLDLRRHLLEQALARRILQQPDGRFDAGFEPDQLRVQRRLRRRHRRQAREETEITDPQHGAARGGGLEETPAVDPARHVHLRR